MVGGESFWVSILVNYEQLRTGTKCFAKSFIVRAERKRVLIILGTSLKELWNSKSNDNKIHSLQHVLLLWLLTNATIF